MNHQIESIDNSQGEENQMSIQEKINNNKTRIDDSDDESEVNEDTSKPVVHNSENQHPPIIHLNN